MSKSEVWFYTGPRNCGKSEQAEQKLSSINNRIYFGTIIDCFENIEIIKRHKQRRDDRWILLETSTFLLSDIGVIRSEINRIDGECACLIDGLTSWLASTTPQINNILHNSKILSSLIVDLINSYTNVIWVLIDVTPNEFYEHETIYSLACDSLYKNILNELEAVYLVNY